MFAYIVHFIRKCVITDNIHIILLTYTFIRKCAISEVLINQLGLCLTARLCIACM